MVSADDAGVTGGMVGDGVGKVTGNADTVGDGDTAGDGDTVRDGDTAGDGDATTVVIVVAGNQSGNIVGDVVKFDDDLLHSFSNRLHSRYLK